jgi:hypothetical protein
MHCSGSFDSASRVGSSMVAVDARWARCRGLLRGALVCALTRFASGRAADAHGSRGAER